MRPFIVLIVFRLFFRFLAWGIAALLVLLAVHFAVPGLNYTWNYPAEGPPWITVRRETGTFPAGPASEIREVSFGRWHDGAQVIIIDSTTPTPAGERGPDLKDGVLRYQGDRWRFHAGRLWNYRFAGTP